MSALQRSTSPPNPTNLSVPEDERILEEDCSAGGSDGSALSRASADAPTSAAPASQPSERIDIENEAASSYPQQTSTSHHNVPRRPARREPFFGIPQPSGAPANFHPNYDDDYETRFPPDPMYQEASENARVYRVYMEESAKYDAYMTDEAREGLDAGLFSAVLTTFVAQTSQSLQPDRATETTLLLREVAALQRAQINGTSIDSIPSTPADFTPSAIDVWVNGLWFTSLMLSLASALFAVLIKQWIRQYMSLTSGTPKERSLIHQFRFMGLQKWHIPTLIGILPVLMHLSLAIFFAGLTLFLVPLHRSIVSIVGSLSALIFVGYVITAVWPLFRIQCPYRTPLSTIIHDITFTLRKYILRRHGGYVSLKEEEHKAATGLGNVLVPHAFQWLVSMSSNLSVHRVVAQAVGGLCKSSSIDKLVNIPDQGKYKTLFQSAWSDMFDDSICLLPDGMPRIRPDKLDLLERLFRGALHIQPASISLILSQLRVRTAIQSFPAPTLKWESAAIAFLWHYGADSNDGDFEDTIAQKACAVVRRLRLEPRNDKPRIPAIVWENLLAAASSCPSIIPFPDLLNPVYNLNEIIIEELINRVCLGQRPSDGSYDGPISFEDAFCASESFVWYLLSPFDRHVGNALDSQNVQRLLSIGNAIVSGGLGKISPPELFLGTCRELICELQAGSVTPRDQEAICVAADALVQEGTALQGPLRPTAVLLPSLIFLHCWTPDITSRAARNAILLALIKIDMFKVLHKVKNIRPWPYSDVFVWEIRANNTAPVASLVTSVICQSFESRTASESQPEDSRWLEYLSLPENSATIVGMFTFQGSTDTPASVEQVRADLLLFFSSQSLDCDTLQKCRTSLESHLKHFVQPYWWSGYAANMKEARNVIDEFISEQSPTRIKPVNPLRRLLRRSRKSPDPEARYPQVEPSPSSTTNTSSS